ncbi:MAG: hypothetical protein COT73_03580 [Bdellovibrio sp. CG10_big_fil_rev_8_21_14_0_10_47_8]|nr:MAG: hypothetical protein COT73_03580 [Bdellovibrio sp. CG10_big_fil_rev_8_21_14_0_10_47_8]
MHQAFWLFITFLVAACSLLYELILAQVLSALLGGTVLRYVTTIGCYLFAMGVGSIIAERFHHKSKESFFRIELLLTLLGLTGPILLLWVHSVAGDAVVVKTIFFYFWVLLIGVLTGLEIPLIVAMAKNNRVQYSTVLAMDYVGSFFGCLFFPWVLLPMWGLLQGSGLVAFINLMVSFFLWIFLKKGKDDLQVHWMELGGMVLLGLTALAIFFSSPDFEMKVLNLYGK